MKTSCNKLIGIALLLLSTVVGCSNSQPEASVPSQPSAPETAVTPAAPVEPATQPLDLQVNHPNGTVLQIKGITFADDNIALDVAVVNGHNQTIQLNQSEMLLRDDIGNTYRLSAPPQNQQLEVAAGQRLEGTLIFLGRVAPGATSLTLTTNDKFGGEQEWATNPKMTIANIPTQAIASGSTATSETAIAQPPQNPSSTTSGSQSASTNQLQPNQQQPNQQQPNQQQPNQAPINSTPTNEAAATGTMTGNNTALDLQARHPNGLVVQVKGVSLNNDTVAIAMSAVNGFDNTVRLNQADMVLRDNLGNKYNLSPPPQNPDVEVASGSKLEGQFIFLGRVAPSATSLSLFINDRFGSTNNQYSPTPQLRIDNIPVRR